MMRKLFSFTVLCRPVYFTVATVLALHVPTDAHGQTRFLWPDSRFDLSNYKHIETCLTVSNRVTDSTTAESTIDTDTLPLLQFNTLNAIPPVVIQSTKQCVSKFPPNAVALDVTYLAQSLYLTAGEDANAQAILMRKLKSIPVNNAAQLFAVVDSGMERYMSARPSRVSAAFDLYDQFVQMGVAVPTKDRVYAIGKLIRGSRLANDKQLSERAFSMLVKFAKSLTVAQWEGDDGVLLSASIYTWLPQLRPVDFEAALAQSTARYQALTEAMFQDLVGRPIRPSFFTTPNQIVGKPSPKLAGDFWFPASVVGTTYPRAGVVTLVVAVEPVKDWANTNVMAAILRRLKQKHPELEIVLMAKTVGWFKQEAPPEPAQEAAFVDSMFRKFYSIPSVLTVTNTRFWRLPGYDRRRINDPTENEENGYLSDHGKIVLIDKEGRAVAVSGQIEIEASREEQLEGLVSVLVKRQSQGQ